MKTNLPARPTHVTHEGGLAKRISPEQELRRTVMACLLWEDSFYESGQSVASRIKDLVAKCDPLAVSALAIEARSTMNLRHVPLLLCRELAALKRLKAGALDAVIQRADELSEFLAIYWKDGRKPISKQVKLGLAQAFTKFNEYALAKYNRDGAVKLRDVLFLTHAKPKDEEQAALWKRLVEGNLATPDTWEVALSSGADKKATWERLLSEKKLGALALLRNLRNMQTAKVDDKAIVQALAEADVRRVLPFRFIAAARFAPQLEPHLESCLLRSMSDSQRLGGTTAVLVDVSGSMADNLSAKSDMRRMDAACGLAMIARELCEDPRIYSFSDRFAAVPPRHGFALRDAVLQSQIHQGTYLGQGIAVLNANVKYDRVIVVTDEQAHDTVPGPIEGSRGYMLNVGTYKNGVGYGKWTHIDGFSEACVRYIVSVEQEQR